MAGRKVKAYHNKDGKGAWVRDTSSGTKHFCNGKRCHKVEEKRG